MKKIIIIAISAFALNACETTRVYPKSNYSKNELDPRIVGVMENILTKDGKFDGEVVSAEKWIIVRGRPSRVKHVKKLMKKIKLRPESNNQSGKNAASGAAQE